MDRRGFLVGSMSALAAHATYGLASDSSPPSSSAPEVTNPRATDGDDRHQPRWDETLTITVGTDKGDLIGKDDRVLQAALDYVARLGGGTVHVLPGTYTLRNAIRLPSQVRLQGSGPETILTKGPSHRVELVADSDWYDQEISLPSGHAFRLGDGVLLQAKNPHHDGTTVIKRTLVAQAGNRFKLDQGLRENLWLSGKPTCAALFPLLTSERTKDVVIENLTLDGNLANNENLNGNYGGCIFLQSCNRYSIRNVIARQFNGDGISFQTCHDVTVEACHCHDNAELGLHPGSGSQRPKLVGNRLERNNIGLFWCWGVKYGLAERNQMLGNRDYGISIGHNDTDNVMRDNEIADTGKVGIVFRDDHRGADFWAHRNLIERNRIRNSGSDNGVAVDIQGKTREVTVRDNEFTETRGARQRIGIRLGPQTGTMMLAENRFAGLAFSVVDQRSR
jgi:hypothetical protein